MFCAICSEIHIRPTEKPKTACQHFSSGFVAFPSIISVLDLLVAFKWRQFKRIHQLKKWEKVSRLEPWKFDRNIDMKLSDTPQIIDLKNVKKIKWNKI